VLPEEIPTLMNGLKSFIGGNRNLIFFCGHRHGGKKHLTRLGTLFGVTIIEGASLANRESAIAVGWLNAQSKFKTGLIDGHNLYLGLKESGITLDFRRFRIYLRDRFHVAEAYYFIGYMPRNQALYAGLQRAGFILQFKEVSGLLRGAKSAARNDV
jgi:hypothetical protein